MSKMKLKICGLKQPQNIKDVVGVEPDFAGFIFYQKSPRYIDGLDKDELSNIPKNIIKVGVFVNEEIEKVIKAYHNYGLDFVQLHGDEDLEFSKELKTKGIKVIKVFRVSDTLPDSLSEHEPYSDYFLFDTASSAYGGSGEHFNWNILSDYRLTTPFLLSGGLDLSDLDQIRDLEAPMLAGIDVNSKFEVSPGLKDVERLRELKAQL